MSESSLLIMFRAFEPSLKNLSIVLERLERYNRADSLHFRKCLGLAKRFGPRGDTYFSLTKTGGGARQGSQLEDSLAFLKIDGSMKEWSEVHFHCPEGEDMDQVSKFTKLNFLKLSVYDF